MRCTSVSRRCSSPCRSDGCASASASSPEGESHAHPLDRRRRVGRLARLFARRAAASGEVAMTAIGTSNGAVQIALFFAVLVATAVPLGRYMARVYQNETTWLDRVVGPLERLL